MLNKIHLKNKMHILLVVSFISVAIISFFFMTNKSYADTTDWSIPGYNGDMEADEKVNADEPKNKYRIGIDDIVYNRVPLFDVNVFNDKPGGKNIDKNSPLFFLRTLVANWFVLGMNLSLAVMIIIIIYTGIRMALSTIAEKQAEYKEMLFNFVKAIAKIFMLAAIMALIMNISQYLTSLFAEKGPDPDSIVGGRNLYVTMVTRALGSISFKAKLPAAILFFGLTLTFFKFCYRYVKRMLNVYLLIIIAPVLVAKDAYEGTSGKQGKTFSAWLQEFTLNVALQPAHALIYTSLVYVALDNATNDVMSFLVAVLILNFMITADKIFFKIFNMRFTKGPGSSGAADALTEGVKMYAGVQAAKEGAKLYGKTVKGTAEVVKRTGRVVGGTAKNVSNKIASMDNGLGEKIRTKRTDKSLRKADKEKEKRLDEKTPSGFLDTLNAITEKKNKHKREKSADRAERQIQNLEQIEEGNGIAGHMPTTLRNYITDAKTDKAIKSLGNARKPSNGDKNFISQMAELRRLSKRNDETGRITRKLLKMKKEHEIKKFKYVAGSVAGVAGQALALFAAPGLVAADESDMALMGITATMGNTTSAVAKHYYYRRNAKDELFAQRSFEDTLQSLRNANTDLGTLQAKFDAIEAHDRDARRDTYIKMSAYSELKLDEHTLRVMLNAYIMKSGEKTLDQARLEELIDRVLTDSGVKDLGINADRIKSSLMAEMLNSQVNNRVNAKFGDALNAGLEEGKTKNKFTEGEVVNLAKDAVKGEDLSELTEKQLVRMIDDAIDRANIENADDVSRKAHDEILKLANEQKESKFTKKIQNIVKNNSSEDAIKEIEDMAEDLIKALAIENEADKDKYVNIILNQLDSKESITSEQRAEIKEKVEEKIAEAINENYRERDKERIDRNSAVSAFALNEKKLVEEELNQLDDTDVLSKDVRDAIDAIKNNVKHEKTKKRSIGTITDLDRQLRHMRDIL